MSENVIFPYRQGLRIMQLTDLHLVRWDGIGPEKQMLDMMRWMIREEKPDLILITGDLACTPTPVECYRGFCEYMDELGLPWAMCMGNHDGEWEPGYEGLEPFLLQSRTCLYRRGTLEGYGNYTVSLTDENGDTAWVLYFLDTHKESYLTPEQTAWYRACRDEIIKKHGKNVPSMVFMHAPFREYVDIRNAGAPGEMREGVSHLSTDSGMLEAFLEKGDIRAVFAGHDHVNDFFGDWKGILLAYGRGTCMGAVDMDGVRRGGYLRPGFLPGCRMIVLEGEKIQTYVRLKNGSTLYKNEN